MRAQAKFTEEVKVRFMPETLAEIDQAIDGQRRNRSEVIRAAVAVWLHTREIEEDEE